MAEFNMPTEVVELPSKGIVYPEDNPLSSGKVEIKYMTAKEEDILTNQSYIEKGIVVDKVLKSVIVSKINYDDLIAGDKNAIMVATRVLGYGGEYEFFSLNKTHKVDLAEIENKPLKEEYFTKGINEFKYTLPFTKAEITWKLLDGRDEKKIDNELEGLKKLYKDNVPTLSTRLKYIITSVNGERERKFIRDYVDKALLARDAKALRKHISDISPDIDLSFFPDGSKISRSIPININFFWPDV